MNNNIESNKNISEKDFLKKYDSNKYKKPSVTVDMIIFTVENTKKKNYRKLSEKKLKILLIKRLNHPYIGMWALPGGFVNIDEDLDTAARRELEEETGLKNIYMEQLYTWGDVKRDPRTRVISCSYMALIQNNNKIIKAGDDAEDAKWFELNYNFSDIENVKNENGYRLKYNINIKLKNDNAVLNAIVEVIKEVNGNKIICNRNILKVDNIAFDHANVISYAIERLRNKIDYTDIVFNLVNNEFTLTELQKVYEIILGKKLLAPAFRRKIKNKVIETDKYTKDAGHRPSRLYRFNYSWEFEKL
jgi:ADP-ribose pyrophosphatase YjhB (NUDIX family)